MKPEIKIEGTDQLVADFKRYGKEAKKAVKRGVDRTAIAVETDAKLRLEGGLGGDKRIKTGNLRASVHAELKQGEAHGKYGLGEKIDDMEAIVGTNVEYAEFIESGTRYIAPMSYLEFAAIRQDVKLRERVTDELNKLVK